MKTKLQFRDLVDESVAGLLARPARAVLTVLGTVLGIAALVATLGVSKTAGNQIVARFDVLSATEIIVRPSDSFAGQRTSTLPWTAQERIERLNGVVAAGTLSDVDVKGALVRSVPINDTVGITEFQTTIKAASPGTFRAVRTKLKQGRVFDAGHSKRGDRVAVIGRGVAERLNLTRVDQQPAVFIGNRLFVVLGIIDDVAREPDLLDSIIIPDGTARSVYKLEAPGTVHIDTDVGAAKLVASQAGIALDPNDPDRLSVSAPQEPKRVKEGVQQDVNSLFLILGAVSLLVGAIGIANVTLVSVLERTGEIGLRRALGAARRHIAGQFLAESTVMGLIGGVIGSSIGVLVVVAVSASRQWTPVLDAWTPIGAPLLGALVGLLAGLYPALRAASLQPVEALRAGT
jgi:ABC-type antimicrobial peptide transport system permease subunit